MFTYIHVFAAKIIVIFLVQGRHVAGKTAVLYDDCSSDETICLNIENAECNQTLCTCSDGFADDGSAVCVADCGAPAVPTNGVVAVPNGTLHEAVVTFSCNDNYERIGEKTRECLSNGEWNGHIPTCFKKAIEHVSCVAGDGWEKAEEGQTITKQCQDNMSGELTRQCLSTGWNPPINKCVRKVVKSVQEKISTLGSDSSADDVSNAIDEMLTVSEIGIADDVDSKLTIGELGVIVNCLGHVASSLHSINVTEETAKDMVEIASNALDGTNANTWKRAQESNAGGAEQVLYAVEPLTNYLAEQIKSSKEKEKVIRTENLVLGIKKLKTETFQSPKLSANNYSTQHSTSSITIPSQAFAAHPDTQFIATTVLYRNMSGIMSAKQDASRTDDTDKEINSPVLFVGLIPPIHVMNPPLQIVLEHLQKHNFRRPACGFWKLGSGGSGGFWSTDGCDVVSTNDTVTVCQCSHMTNFAVLMSPFVEGDVDSSALRIVSIVGVSVSILTILITLAVHIRFWRNLRCDRVTILMNLCSALIVAYIVFLAGVDRTESKAFCTVIAVFLHYLYLVVFSLMLVEGIEIGVMVLYVFATKSRIKILLTLAWLVPGIIVGISLGVTKTEGYGNKNFCWLSVNSGLIWAFVGPALTIIMFNLVCLIIAMCAMARTKTMGQKKTKEKIKTSVRSLCVLVPLMGISWIVGLFYINDDFAWTQYVFSICNGLQGCSICLFHCFLNPQVKKAYKIHERRTLSKSSFKTSTLRSLSRDDSKRITMPSNNNRRRATNQTYINDDINDSQDGLPTENIYLR